MNTQTTTIHPLVMYMNDLQRVLDNFDEINKMSAHVDSPFGALEDTNLHSALVNAIEKLGVSIVKLSAPNALHYRKKFYSQAELANMIEDAKAKCIAEGHTNFKMGYTRLEQGSSTKVMFVPTLILEDGSVRLIGVEPI